MFSKISGSLTGRFIGWFLFVSIVPIIIIGFLSVSTARGALEDATIDELDTVSSEKGASLVGVIENFIINGMFLAQEHTVTELTSIMVNADGNVSAREQQDAQAELKGFLTEFADFYGGSGAEGGLFADIMIGDVIHAPGYMWIGTYGPDEGGNEFDTEWFQEGRKGPYLSSIAYNPAMDQVTQKYLLGQ